MIERLEHVVGVADRVDLVSHFAVRTLGLSGRPALPGLVEVTPFALTAVARARTKRGMVVGDAAGSSTA
jgi:hypothetical protein